jgi:hypothetical protein
MKKLIAMLLLTGVILTSCTKDDGKPECKKQLTKEEIQKMIDDKKIS